MMPEMDGFEFLERFRATPQWRDVPVIVITAKQLTPAEREQLSGHVRSVIAKGASFGVDVAAAVELATRQRPAVANAQAD